MTTSSKSVPKVSQNKSQTAQWRYKILKLAQVIIAGLIPLASVFPDPRSTGEMDYRNTWSPRLAGCLNQPWCGGYPPASWR
jgi:hypothetical protein